MCSKETGCCSVVIVIKPFQKIVCNQQPWATPQCNWLVIGCYSSSLCSYSWTPGSSGKARCNRTCQRGVGFPNQDLCGVLLVLIKLAAIALPILINGPAFSDENNRTIKLDLERSQLIPAMEYGDPKDYLAK